MPEAGTDTAPATADTAPDGDATTQTTDTQTTTDATNDDGAASSDKREQVADNDFSLPDEYKDQKWAKGLKTQEDVWKKLANSQELIGKKVIKPIDYETATPEEISSYHSNLAPEDAGDYNFGENADPEFSKAVGDVFKEYGINTYQAEGLSEKINQIATGKWRPTISRRPPRS